jgi:putative tryptophan/tyrosine transport system substrate-binding protein
MMDRRTFMKALAVGFVTASRVAIAQTTGAVPRVGVLLQTVTTASATLSLLEPALRERGYTSGKDIVLEARSSGGKPEALPGLAADLVRRNVTVMVAVGPAAVKAAIDATRSIPIVAIDLETDPVQSGWVSTLARPGGNITGLFLDHPGMAGKWLDLLRETTPSARRVALLWDSTTSASPLEAAKAAAQGFSIDVHVVQIRSIDDVNAALDADVGKGTQAIVMLSSPNIWAASARIAEFTKRQRIPAISPFRPFAEAGGLMTYGPDLPYFFRRSAIYIDKILKGEKAGDLPVELPTKFELIINLKTAKALGITVPQSLLLRADEVIQ